MKENASVWRESLFLFSCLLCVPRRDYRVTFLMKSRHFANDFMPNEEWFEAEYGLLGDEHGTPWRIFWLLLPPGLGVTWKVETREKVQMI